MCVGCFRCFKELQPMTQTDEYGPGCLFDFLTFDTDFKTYLKGRSFSIPSGMFIKPESEGAASGAGAGE